MITESQIREQLLGYLVREISLNDFEDWLVVQSWNMHLDSDDAAQNLVGAIELRLAEYSDDHLTDAGLERELTGLIASSTFGSFERVSPIEPVVNTVANSSVRVISVEVALAA